MKCVVFLAATLAVSAAQHILGGFSHLYGIGPDNIEYPGGNIGQGYALGLAGYGFYGPEIVSVGPGFVDYGASGQDAFAAAGLGQSNPGVFLAAASAPEETKVTKDGEKVVEKKDN